jgi:hypothetical protein
VDRVEVREREKVGAEVRDAEGREVAAGGLCAQRARDLGPHRLDVGQLGSVAPHRRVRVARDLHQRRYLPRRGQPVRLQAQARVLQSAPLEPFERRRQHAPKGDRPPEEADRATPHHGLRAGPRVPPALRDPAARGVLILPGEGSASKTNTMRVRGSVLGDSCQLSHFHPL